MDRDRWSARQEFLWKLLREIRKEAGLTQAELSHKLQRNQQYVSKYELGERRLDLFEILDICNACGISMGDLVARLETKTNKTGGINH